MKLRGLNRHQTFPYVGGAMPGRVQRRDAIILKRELKCNIVRTSHYPQSPAFLDCCDEIGLLVLEEIPGWQHIGDATGRTSRCATSARWSGATGIIPRSSCGACASTNRSDNHDFYTRTNQLAHELDDSRQTGGMRYITIPSASKTCSR